MSSPSCLRQSSSSRRRICGLATFWLVLGLAFVASTASAEKPAKKPNIVVIMADDLGWSNLSSYHHGMMSSRTPNIDRIAKEGMRFTDYYAQPSCTAGRSAFITGQLPIRTGLHTVGLPHDPIGIGEDTPTLARLLKNLGYKTAEFGKNHLGDRNDFLPTTFGFDEYWGWLYHLNAMEYTNDPDWPDSEAFNAQFKPRNMIHSWATDTEDTTEDPDWGVVGFQKIEDDGPCPPERQKDLESEINRHSMRFIRESVKDDEPFFLWHNPSRVHVWTHLSEEYEKQIGVDQQGMHEVAMKELDDHVGELLDLLDELGIADDTIVIFTADNGPEIMTWPDAGMTPFHGEKGTTWEGGFRVPMIIRWPGNVPANTVNNGIFDGMDFLPTLVAAAGGPDDVKERLLSEEGYDGYRAHLDGYNQMATLRDPEAPSERKEIIFYEGTDLQAVRYGQWKAHFVVQNEGWFGAKEELNASLLFNLRRDPYEKAADESLTYMTWMGKKMWAFGPMQRVVEQHLATFEDWPPPGQRHKKNLERLKELFLEDHPFAQ